MSMRPLSDPGARDRIAPFAGVAIIAVVLGLLPPTSSNIALRVTVAVVTVVVIALVAVSTRIGPRMTA